MVSVHDVAPRQSAQQSLRRSIRLGLLAGVLLQSLGVAAADETPAQFTRFLDEGLRQGRFQTAIASYENSVGVRVDLVAVVHIGDRGYYRRLEARFPAYEALLYELIAEPEDVPEPGRQSASPIGFLQRGMKTLLDLDFQLDAIDYRAPNFVHADLDPATFARLQRERGESILMLFLKNALRAWEAQQGADSGRTQPELQLADLVAAFLSGDSARALKYVLAQELDDMERTISGLEADGDSVILTERNKHAFGVLEQQIAAGRRNLALFYGAAHMPDLEQRLFASGYRRTGHEWITAWQIGPPKATDPTPEPQTSRRKIETF
ncbi:MAG: hypothetical protein AB7O52_08020 [Planctomycetota bacterium]